jgi:hypothetical protein
MMESWLSPMYQREVSPVSATPVMPSSVCILSTTASDCVAGPPDMTMGLAKGMDTGMHSTLVIFTWILPVVICVAALGSHPFT